MNVIWMSDANRKIARTCSKDIPIPPVVVNTKGCKAFLRSMITRVKLSNAFSLARQIVGLTGSLSSVSSRR